jgi:hypothetical protein
MPSTIKQAVATLIAEHLIQRGFVVAHIGLDQLSGEIASKIPGEQPHYVIYYMCSGEIGSNLYDSYQEAVDDIGNDMDMMPVPVFGIPREDPEEPEDDED